MLTVHATGLEPLVVLLETRPGVTLLGIPPVAVFLGIIPVDLGMLPGIAPIIASVVMISPAFTDLTATVVVIASLHGVGPFGLAFVGKVTRLACVALS